MLCLFDGFIFLIFVVEINVEVIVDGGAVPALVKQLESPVEDDAVCALRLVEHEVEKECAFAIGLLAVKVIPIG